MATTKFAHNRSLSLLGSFVQALAHDLRTPLSVIANDLTYLQHKYPKDEIDRTLGQVERVAALLKKAVGLSDAALQCEPVSLRELLRRADLSFEAFAADSTVMVDVERTIAALQELLKFIEAWSGGKMTIGAGNREIRFSNFFFADSKGDYSSLTSFFCKALNNNNLTAPLVDALLEAQGIDVVINSGDNFSLKLEFA